MKKNGFTLIDVLVSVSVISLIIVVITGILMNTLKVKTRVSIADVVERNGTFALAEIRRNIINSSAKSIVCAAGGSSLTLAGQDGQLTQIICNEGGKIASSSANGVVDLTDSDVTVAGCGSFVSCSTAPSTEVSMVNIGFILASGVEEAGVESYVSKNFEIKVAVRN